MPLGAFALLVALVSLARIALTYGQLNHIYDESAHIAVGMEWLDNGTYRYERLHPPMRAVTAIGPWLLGARYGGVHSMWDEGHRILYGYGKYWQTLTSARVAMLPFFALTLAIVFAWTRRIAGTAAAVMALIAYSTLPLALAHAGVATTDTLVTGTFAAAMFAWARWLERPGTMLALLFGVAAGAAVLSKFTALPYLGLTMIISAPWWLMHQTSLGAQVSAADRRRAFIRGAGIAVPIACVVVWAGYRFSMGQLWTAAGRPHGMVSAVFGASGSLHDLANTLVELPLPAPELFLGIGEVLARNKVTAPSMFLGGHNYGNVAFFPVAMIVKTPIPFLLLTIAGLASLLRRNLRSAAPGTWLPVLASLVVMAVGMMMSLNIGLRHVLPMFPFLAICAGVGAARLWNSQLGVRPLGLLPPGMPGKLLVIVLFGWQIVAGVRQHPDYLAYFNECCSDHPERWLNDSDLDWGQDLNRLSIDLKARGVESLRLVYHGTADPELHALPAHAELEPYQHAKGWIAISEWNLALGTGDPPYDQYNWLNAEQPVVQVGKSIRVYHLP